MPRIKKFNLNLNHSQKENIKKQEKNKQKRINIIKYNQIIYHAPNLIKKKSKEIIETIECRIKNVSNEQQNVKRLIRKIT